MKYFSYDELEGFQVFNSLEKAQQKAEMLKGEEEDEANDSLKGIRILICYGTIEEIVFTNDTDLEIDLTENAQKEGDTE